MKSRKSRKSMAQIDGSNNGTIEYNTHNYTQW